MFHHEIIRMTIDDGNSSHYEYFLPKIAINIKGMFKKHEVM